jgi:excisionase family DNA binding protein
MAANAQQLFFTVAEVAERYRCSVEKVLRLIAQHKLRALDTGAGRGRKGRFVVSAQALADYELRQSCGPPLPRTRRRRQRQGDVMRFF